MVNLCLVFFSFVLDSSQDPLPKEEEIIAEVPYFYYWDPSVGADYSINFDFKRPGIKRSYTVKILNEDGTVILENLEEMGFYSLAKRILAYGVRDSWEFLPGLNIGFQRFISLLLEKKIISKEDLKFLAMLYWNKTWFESLYCLDEAAPGIVEKEKWQNLEKIFPRNMPSASYSNALIRIKLGETAESILKSLDNSQLSFSRDAKLYAELACKGAVVPPDVQRRLLSSFLEGISDNPKSFSLLVNYYKEVRLPLHNNEILSNVLEEYLSNKNEIHLECISFLRKAGFSFPKRFAGEYRDRLLRIGGSLEDIEYLVKICGEEAQPWLWKKYGDHYYWWYKKQRDAQEYYDQGESYHLAIIAYQRASKLGLRIGYENIQELLKATDNFLVSILDIIRVYELAEIDPKTNKEILAILEKRAEDYNEFPKSGFILPFRDEIELAFYLENSNKAQNAAKKLAAYFREMFILQGVRRSDDYENSKITIRNWIFLNLEFYYGSPNREYPYKIFKEILGLYESLNFSAGARSLAEALLESGFVMQARRAFKIGGLEKEAEEQLYSQYDEKHWIEYERRVVARLRWKGFWKD